MESQLTRNCQRHGGGSAGDYLQEGAPLKLDDALVISAVPKFSSLLSRPFKAATDGTEERYTAFHFFPDGSTDLPAGQLWFLTLFEERHASADGSAPANFITIQIHPTSGKVRTFRP